jgi:hypothetical protein
MANHKNLWVKNSVDAQASGGLRCRKPPIIFNDLLRSKDPYISFKYIYFQPVMLF